MKHHVIYYVTLLIVLGLGIGLAMFVHGQKQLQVALIVLTSIFYVIWGVVHHTVHHSFSVKIMLEYIAIAIFGISIIFFVLNIAL
ncbi:MAG TPA: hypothetical protein VF820_04865 [Patescibacteria group bacterium]